MALSRAHLQRIVRLPLVLILGDFAANQSQDSSEPGLPAECARSHQCPLELWYLIFRSSMTTEKGQEDYPDDAEECKTYHCKKDQFEGFWDLQNISPS